MSVTRTISLQHARRLSIAAQQLTGPSPPVECDADADGMARLVHALGCVQIDAVRAVEQTQYLVLWSRLGRYDPALLDDLLFKQYRLFEYWAHAASIVATEDYPLHATRMRRKQAEQNRSNDWIAANAALYDHVIERLRADGPLPTDAFDDLTVVPWTSSGWNDNRNVAIMLTLLWERGEVMIAGRKQRRRYWDLTDRCLPDHVRQTELSDFETQRRAVRRALKALGVATPAQIKLHFLRHQYPQLPEVLDALQDEGEIEPVVVAAGDGEALSGAWMLHRDSRTVLDALERHEWQPRTVLLSPFDNLICDRNRTEQLFDFRYRIEIYVPKAKREYGYYVLPILHDDGLVGRMDLQMDRTRNRLIVNGLYAEDRAPAAAAAGIGDTTRDLAAFLGADAVDWPDSLPPVWQHGLS